MYSYRSRLAPTSTPLAGSASSSTLAWKESHLPTTTFCWLPPERAPTGMSRLWALIDRVSTARAHSARYLARGVNSGCRAQAQPGEDDVGEHRVLQEQAFQLAVAGHQQHAGADGVRRPVEADPAAADLRLAGEAGVAARQGEQQLVLPLPGQAADAQDLAALQLEGDVPQRLPVVQPLHPQHRLALPAGAPALLDLDPLRLPGDVADDALRVAPVGRRSPGWPRSPRCGRWSPRRRSPSPPRGGGR